jgi:hypothetical protein
MTGDTRTISAILAAEERKSAPAPAQPGHRGRVKFLRPYRGAITGEAYYLAGSIFDAGDKAQSLIDEGAAVAADARAPVSEPVPDLDAQHERSKAIGRRFQRELRRWLRGR